MSPSEPPDGSPVVTVFVAPPQRFPYVETWPTVGTETLDVSLGVIADPTAAKLTFVTVNA